VKKKAEEDCKEVSQKELEEVRGSYKELEANTMLVTSRSYRQI
jgi:hypothetical protein